MVVNYYQLTTLIEVEQKVLNFSGLATDAIFFLFLAITLGQPSLDCIKKLVKYIKRTRDNSENFQQTETRQEQRNLQRVVVNQR